MAGRRRFGSGATVAIGLVVGACGCGGQSAPTVSNDSRGQSTPTTTPMPTPTGEAPATITSPQEGSQTRRRFVVVRGTVPGAPKGASRNVRVFANGWFTDVAGVRASPLGGRVRHGTFREEVPLRVGRNALAVKVTFETYDEDTEKFTVIDRTAAAVSLTRKRSVDTGKLDRATAYTVTEDMGAVYSLCGESDDCGTQIWCLRVGTHRVDCPVGVWEYPSFVRQCAFVATVRVRHRRVLYGRYRCSGRVNPSPSRHIVREAKARLHRYRSSPGTVSERNDYGLPRFDARADLFMP